MSNEDPDIPVTALRTNAQLLIAELAPWSDVEPFGFNAESVEWVDGDLERQRVRDDLTPELQDGLVSVIGVPRGAIIATWGGAWVQEQHNLGVRTLGGVTASPSPRSPSSSTWGGRAATRLRCSFSVLPLIAEAMGS